MPCIRPICLIAFAALMALAGPAAATCALEQGPFALGVEVRLQRDEGGGRWVDRSWGEAPKPGEQVRLAVTSAVTVYISLWMGQPRQMTLPHRLWPRESGWFHVIKGGATTLVPAEGRPFVLDAHDQARGWTLVVAPEPDEVLRKPFVLIKHIRATVDRSDDDRLCLTVPRAPVRFPIWRWTW